MIIGLPVSVQTGLHRIDKGNGKILLGSGLIIRHLRNHQPTVQLMRTLGQTERLAIAAITRLEVHAGMKSDERYKTQKLISRFVCYDLDPTIADRTGDLIHSLPSKNHGISIPDAIIAVTALVYQLTVVTYNQAHFAIVPGLRLYPLP